MIGSRTGSIVTPVALSVLVLSCGGGLKEGVADHARQGTGTVLQAFPADIDPANRYLIYLHNRFLESAEPGQVHPRFGSYEFEAILERLATDGLTVIGERRPDGADPRSYARRVADQVHALILAGVPPPAITVVGFSKGGAIAIFASSEIANDDVGFVILAACGPWIRAAAGLEPRGRLLSIREASDDLAGSCDVLFERASEGSDTLEIELTLGGGHGAFFRPHPEWVDPIVDWALGSAN
jgi:hypothetical protein